MTKAERTRRHIVEKTAPVFNRKGFDGTSLSDLTQITGLTKGALYGNFGGKEEIAVAAFKYSMGKVRQMVGEHLSTSSSYKEKLLALLNFYSSYVFAPPIPGGCPLLNTAVEADDYHTSMRRIVVKELTNTTDFIRDLIVGGIEAGEFRTGIQPKQIAYALFCAIEGALMFSRVERSREPMDLIIGHCTKILDQISS